MPRLQIQLTTLCFFLAALCFSGCGGEVAISDFISIKLSGIKEGDVHNGQASADKNVNTEEGNPYAEFLRAIDEELNGARPGAIEVDSLTLHVHSDSKGVSDFMTVFESIEVFISTNETTLALGVIEDLEGSSIELLDISNGNLEPIQDSLANGSFEVGVRGPTHISLPDDFDLKISMEVKFSAYR